MSPIERRLWDEAHPPHLSVPEWDGSVTPFRAVVGYVLVFAATFALVVAALVVVTR
jgi:hypothetical protein